MQKRHIDRSIYFMESSNTSREFYIPYIERFKKVLDGDRVLEIGCGEGGNLFPFVQRGCRVAGIDIAQTRIVQGRNFFMENHCQGTFKCGDFLKDPVPEQETDKYDIILLHDVIEHIADKRTFLSHIRGFLKKKGILFVAFPAWQMPFGGHQQICKSRIFSKIPFIHLLSYSWYTFFLRHVAKENVDTVRELLYIKRCGTSVEKFEQTVKAYPLHILNRQLWLVNPHYKQKFNLQPIKLSPFLSNRRYLRDYFSTSCFYLLGAD